MITIRDVAKASGYSISSVSRVINNNGYVSSEAREKIESTIIELDYKPNQMARDLSLGHTNKVGVVIPHTKHPYFLQILSGIIDEAQKSNYNIVLLSSDYNESLELEFLEMLKGRAFDSLIFTSHSIDLKTVSEYTKYGPIVCLEPTEYKSIRSVYVDKKEAYRELFHWMKAKKIGKTVMLFTRADNKSKTYRETIHNFVGVFGNSKEFEIFDKITSYEDGYLIAKTTSKMEGISCILTNGDDIAMGLSRYYSEQNLDMPIIVSQEKQLVGELLKIPTIENKSYKLGVEAFNQSIDTENKKIILESIFLSNDI